MLNVFAAAKKHSVPEPYLQAIKELAEHPQSGTFMQQGEYAPVEIQAKYVFPPVLLTFVASNGITVSAGKYFACFENEEYQRACLWKITTIKNHPDEPLVA